MAEIYGADLSKEVTPIVVRDAIITCFSNAHKEILEAMKPDLSIEEYESMKKTNITILVKNIFKDVREDFENPTNEGLVKVIGKLQEVAKEYRKPELVAKHTREIMTLMEKLE